MFKDVQDLSKRLPRPAFTGNPQVDRRARQVYIANGERLRSEAVACMGRAFMATLRRGWRQVSRPILTPPSHQA